MCNPCLFQNEIANLYKNNKKLPTICFLHSTQDAHKGRSLRKSKQTIKWPLLFKRFFNEG